MKRSIHRMASALLAAILILTMAAGCTKDTSKETKAPDTTAGSTEKETEGNTDDWHAQLPEGFAITLMLNDFEGSPNSGEYGEQILNMIKEYTGYDIQIQWVTSDNFDDKLGTVLASGVENMPMIIPVKPCGCSCWEQSHGRSVPAVNLKSCSVW